MAKRLRSPEKAILYNGISFPPVLIAVSFAKLKNRDKWAAFFHDSPLSLIFIHTSAVYIKFRAFKSIGKTPVYCIALHCRQCIAAGNIWRRHIVDHNIRDRNNFKEAPGRAVDLRRDARCLRNNSAMQTSPR